MKELTMERAVEKVVESKPDATVRVWEKFEIGKVPHQGDVYLHMVSDKHSKGKRIAKGSVQIALGTNNGARHVAEGNLEVFEGKKLPEWMKFADSVNLAEVTGPVIVAKERFALTHPEHAHHSLPAGVYQVQYQYDWKTARRVAD